MNFRWSRYPMVPGPPNIIMGRSGMIQADTMTIRVVRFLNRLDELLNRIPDAI